MPWRRVGKDGVITVEEGKTRRNGSALRGGDAVRQRLHFSLLHHRCRLDGSPSLENALVLIYEKKISNIRELVPIAGKGLLKPVSRC